MKRVFPPLLALACSACTLEPGSGFATLESATVEARLESDPLVSAGGQRISFSLLTFTIGHVVLEGRSASGEGLPNADCHGDHCHGEDEEEPAAGVDDPVPIVEAHFDAPLDVLAGETLRTVDFEPSAELPLATVERVRIELEALRAEGMVEGGGSAAPVPFAIDVAEPGAYVAIAERAIDRDHGASIDLAIELEVGPEAFAHVDFATAGSAEVVEAILSGHVHVSFDGAEP